jgi:hypothetical protein
MEFRLTRIEERCFSGCVMKRVCIPRSVEILDAECFSGIFIDALTFEAESLLRRVGEWCFVVCSLKSFCIPSSVKMIGKSCFESEDIKILYGPSGKLSLRMIIDEDEMMELEIIAIDYMEIIVDGIASSCTIIQSETAILLANIKYQARKYEVKSVSNSVIEGLSSAGMEVA